MSAQRKLKQARLAALIARDFEQLARTSPDALIRVSYSWEAIERLAKRLELLPQHVAAILVSEGVACDLPTQSEAAAVPAVTEAPTAPSAGGAA
jgi:hypothetical protein